MSDYDSAALVGLIVFLSGITSIAIIMLCYLMNKVFEIAILYLRKSDVMTPLNQANNAVNDSATA